MDTPERSQIGTPFSKIEDSPFFNYINNLSPIEPVKSANISQTLNSLSLASISSVFTSPHVKEFRVMRRHQSSDQHKCENFSDTGNHLSSGEGVTSALQIYGDSSVSPGSFLREASSDSPNEHPNLVVHLSGNIDFDSGSPEDGSKPCSSGGRVDASELDGQSALLVPSIPGVSKNVSLPGEVKNPQRREESECDWETLLSETTDLLIVSSPHGTEANQGPRQKLISDKTFCTSGVPEFPQEDFTTYAKQPGAEYSSSELERTEQIIIMDDEAVKCAPFPCKPAFNLHRGMRRSLLFEMVKAPRKNSSDASDSSCPSHHEGKIPADNEQQAAFKRQTLSGIGLHLNSLATTSKENKISSLEISATEIQVTSIPNSFTSPPSTSTDQETKTDSLELISVEGEKDLNENEFDVTENILQASVSGATEEFNPISPKKKKRRSEQVGELETCKRCNCKKSKCLKLYCECFAAGVYCVEPCSCQECFNKPIHELKVLETRKQIESRNPFAFAPKVVRSFDSVAEVGDEPSKTPASARHKSGCNCKKSSCLKKYCECYQGGVGCSIRCRCEGCKNAFGRKDGSTSMGRDIEPEEGAEAETCENLQNTVARSHEESTLESATPITPLRIRRPSAELPSLSKRRRPPPSSSVNTSRSSSLQLCERAGRPNFLPPRPKHEKHFKTAMADELPDILLDSCSPSHGVKSSSPNSKRVSPPHCHVGSSPGRRSSTRKLILQSIPSFPSLTQN